jgi:hypothetical protein
MRENNGVPTELDKQKAATAQAEFAKTGAELTNTATDLPAADKAHTSNPVGTGT